MSNVRAIGTNFAADCAAGLEAIARQIRAGEISPHRVFVVMTIKRAGEDHVGGQFFGADASTSEVVGMLELAKYTAIQECGDG